MTDFSGSPPPAPTNTGQQVASKRLLGEHPPNCLCNDCQWFNSREAADALEF